MRILAALAIASSLWGQRISPGLRLGVPVTARLTVEGPYDASGPRFTIGPCVEVRLWGGVAAGADFLFRRTGLERAAIWEWEAPVALVYRFPTGPFVRAGVAFNRVFRIGNATECARGPSGERFYCVDGGAVAELRHRSTYGFMLGGGYRWRLGRVRIEPEIRLTHWTDRNVGVRDSAVRSNLNQVAVLFGVAF